MLKVVQQGGLTNTHPDSSDTLVLVQPTLANPPQLQTTDFDQFGALDNPVEGAHRIDVSDELFIGLIKSWPLNATGLGWIDDAGSVDGRIRCAPWHDPQFATLASPALLFKPW